LLGERDRRERVKLAVTAMTRLRVCAPDGRMEIDFGGAPGDAPKGNAALVRAAPAGPRDHPLRPLVGARLQARPGYVALDSGVVWGRALTAVRLDDGAVFHQPAVER
jgi:bis(5'-nucleosyl)-tetraphosphatase (symmetrical)